MYTTETQAVVREAMSVRIISPDSYFRYTVLKTGFSHIFADFSLIPVYEFSCNIIKKVKLSLYRPWNHLGLREVEAHTYSDSQLADGGKFVSPMRRLLFTPRKFLVLISLRG
jgi:hypothetical protein